MAPPPRSPGQHPLAPDPTTPLTRCRDENAVWRRTGHPIPSHPTPKNPPQLPPNPQPLAQPPFSFFATKFIYQAMLRNIELHQKLLLRSERLPTFAYFCDLFFFCTSGAIHPPDQRQTRCGDRNIVWRRIGHPIPFVPSIPSRTPGVHMSCPLHLPFFSNGLVRWVCVVFWEWEMGRITDARFGVIACSAEFANGALG